ncbi:MAG: hypothetical protein K8R02_01550 [Anaerohalosphaeraceae bacterium]|nr:hypothetical protein [Anaerohalosphaeraceae bacterium]
MFSEKKQIPAGSKSILLIVCMLVFSFAAFAQNAEPNLPVVRKRPVKTFRLISFTLNDGQRVSGRIVTKGPIGFEIAIIDGSQIKLARYYRDDIQPRSIIYSKSSALDYWRNAGDYFLEKVGDFKDDPDEFIQAIRCFEKAKFAVSAAMGPEHKLVAELGEKIGQTKAEMDRWVELVTPRAELRKLEVLSTIDQQFEGMQTKVETNTKELAGVQIKLAGYAATAQGYEKIRDRLSRVETLASSFQQRIERMENDVYDLWRYYRNRNVYYNSPVIKNSDSQNNP